MAGQDKIVNLVVRAKDEYTKTLGEARKAANSLSQASREANARIFGNVNLHNLQKQLQQTGQEIRKMQADFQGLVAAGRVGESATRDLAASLVLARGRSAELRDAVRQQQAELHRMNGTARGSFAAFNQVANGMRQQATEAERLTQRLAGLRAQQAEVTGRVTGFATAQRSAPGITNLQNAEREIRNAQFLKNAIRQTETELGRLTGTAQGGFAAMDRVAVAMQKQDIAAGDLAPALQQTVAGTNAVTVAQRQARTSIDRTTASLDRQILTRLSERRRGGLDQSARGEQQDVALFGLKPYQLTNLAYQANDVISGLAMGQQPVQVLAQQLGQVLQIFPQFTRLFFTAAPAVLAFGAVLAAPIARIEILNASVSRFTRELAFNADGARYSAQALGELAQELDGLGFTLADARDGLTSLTRAGVDPTRLREFMLTARDLARVTGSSVPEAIEQMQTALAGGAAGVRELDKNLNFLTSSQLAAINAAYESGGAAAGQEAAFDALQEAIGRTTSASGPWTDATIAVGQAWRNLMDALGESNLIQGAMVALDALGKSAAGLAIIARDTAGYFADDNFDVGTVAERLSAVSRAETEMYREIAQLREDNAGLGAGVFVNEVAVQENQRRIDELKAQADQLAALREDLKVAFNSPDAALIDDYGSEEYLKRVEDLRFAMNSTNSERQRSVELIGMEARAAAESTARQEAERLAREANVGATDAATQAIIQSYVDQALAAYDAAEAVKVLGDAEQTAAELVGRMATEQERVAATVEATESAIATLTAKYGSLDPRVIAATNALNRFKNEAAAAARTAGSLTSAAVALRNALSQIGSFNADLDRRFIRAQNQIGAIQAGVSELSLDAQDLAVQQSDAALAAGASADQAAAAYNETLTAAERTLAAERALQDLRSETYNPTEGGGGGESGGGASGPTAAEAAEERINALVALREAMLERIQFLRNDGQAQAANELEPALVGVNAQLTAAIDNSIALLSSLSGPEAATAILGMQQLRDEIEQNSRATQEFLMTAEDINESLADVGVSLIDALAKGDNVFDALKTSAGKFLIELGLLIAKQAIFNALTQSFGGVSGGIGGILAGAVGSLFGAPVAVNHSGGVVGEPTRTRSTGARLRSDEVRTVLQRGEEVLTKDDPRHRDNVLKSFQRMAYHSGGIAGASADSLSKMLKNSSDSAQPAAPGGDVKVNMNMVTVLDPAEILTKALETEVGQQTFFNFLTRNSQTASSALGER